MVLSPIPVSHSRNALSFYSPVNIEVMSSQLYPDWGGEIVSQFSPTMWMVVEANTKAIVAGSQVDVFTYAHKVSCYTS